MTIPSFVIGIAGGTGAGKTTVAHEVTGEFDEAVTHVLLDNYYEDVDRSLEERESINYDHPSAFEWGLLRTQLEALLEGRAIETPQYDFTDHVRTDERIGVEPADVVVVEGSSRCTTRRSTGCSTSSCTSRPTPTFGSSDESVGT